METKREKIMAIFKDLRDEQDWGGSEDSDGALHPGTPNLSEAEDKILAILDEPDRINANGEFLDREFENYGTAKTISLYRGHDGDPVTQLDVIATIIERAPFYGHGSASDYVPEWAEPMAKTPRRRKGDRR